MTILQGKPRSVNSQPNYFESFESLTKWGDNIENNPMNLDALYKMIHNYNIIHDTIDICSLSVLIVLYSKARAGSFIVF